VSGSPAAVVATYRQEWEAHLAREALAEAGIPAWVESAIDVAGVSGTSKTRVLVPQDRTADAVLVLAELTEPPENGDPVPSDRGRPLWIGAVAGLLAAALLVTSVPQVVWVPLLLAGFVGFLLWRAMGPRRPS
jgi:hypothetical protein